MMDKGYKPGKENINPSSKDTGSFEMNYKKENGETAKIQGKMKNGKMEELKSSTSEEKKKIMDKLKQNKKFQKFDRELRSQGFKQDNVEIEQSEEKTTAKIKYKNKENQTASIKAEFEKGEITKVELENENPGNKAGKPYYLLLLIAIMAVIGYLLYKKYYRKKVVGAVAKMQIQEGPFDYLAEYKRLLENARRLFEQEKYKDAYGEAARALRFFLSYGNGVKKEQTNDELIKYLRDSGKPYKEIKECFDLCNLVEFAKYQANREDFDRILEIAGKVESF